MLDEKFSYKKFFDGLQKRMSSGGLLLIDSVDPEITDRPEYKTYIKPEELIQLAAKKLWYPIFFKRDGGVQVHRDFFIFKRL